MPIVLSPQQHASFSRKPKNDSPPVSREFPEMTPQKAPRPDRILAPWTEPVKPFRGSRPSLLIRNRGILPLQKKCEEPKKSELIHRSSQIGHIKQEGASRSALGFGSGVLVGNNLFLTAKHCLKSADMAVTFADFRGPVPISHTFKVEAVLSTEGALAKEMGVMSGLHPELVLLRLAPQEVTGSLPGELLGFSPLTKPSQISPKRLTYYGYTNGNGLLKASESEVRPYDLKDAVSRKWLKAGHQLTWNNRAQGGTIERVVQRKGTTYIKVRSEDKRSEKGVAHTFTVHADGTVRKLNGTGRLVISDALVEPGILIGPDHVILTHATSDGSSGGAYFTEDGELFAIHIGRFKNNLFRGAAEKGFEHHIAFFPWAENVISFYEPYIKKETRFELKNIASITQKTAEAFVGCELKINGVSRGIISSLDSPKKGGYKFLIGENYLVLPADFSLLFATPIKYGADPINRDDIVIEHPVPVVVVEAKPDTTRVGSVVKSGIEAQPRDSEKAVLRRFEDYIVRTKPPIQSFVGDTHHVILDKLAEQPAVKAHLGTIEYKEKAKGPASNRTVIKVYLDPKKGVSSIARALYIIDGKKSSIAYYGRADH